MPFDGFAAYRYDWLINSIKKVDEKFFNKSNNK